MIRRFTMTLLAATAMGVIASQGASAADILRKAPPVALPPPVQDWSGIYVGIEGGYGWGHQSFSSTVPFRLNGANTKCLDGKAGLFAGDCTSFSEFNDFQEDLTDTTNPDLPISGANSHGGVVGGFFGAQKQWGNWVLGLEGSIDYAHISKSTDGVSDTETFTTDPPSDNINRFTSKTNNVGSFTSTIDTLGAVNAKVGYAMSPSWLIYGTGGLGFAHEKNTFSFSQSLFHLDCDSDEFAPGAFGCNGATGDVFLPDFEGLVRTANETFVGSGGTTMFGWTAGAGIDYKWQLDAGSAVVFGVDYKHYGFGHHTLSLAGADGATFSVDATQSVDVVKGRLSYLFSIH